MLDIMKLDIETKYIIFATSQFFIGFLVNCVYCTAYVLLMEISKQYIVDVKSYRIILNLIK